MLNRIFRRTKTQETQSPPFGLVAWLEQTKVTLPLKGVECRFHVCGDLLNVEVDQIFHQNSTQPMDCLYTFPLPAGAAVYRCEMHVNGRIIRAKVEEQERAREIARKQRAAGRRTALVEVERDNLFTLSLGNVQPGDLVVIRFAYFQTLTRLADWTSLRVPFCPGVRYIPGQPLLRALRGRGTEDDTDQVPDASRLSPPRLDALHPDSAYLAIEGTVENPAGVVTEISSPSHPVLVRDGEEGQRSRVSLADRNAVPDCDFVLRWTETPRESVQPAGWVLRGGKEEFALVRLQAPRVAAVSDDAGQDFYFLVDRSGSMEGLKWQKALQAFRSFLQLLGARDRAWLTFFNDRPADFAERPLTAAEWSKDGGLARLDHLGAGGGTELLPALQHVLKALAKHSSGRRAALVLITDGEVGNEGAILEALRPHAGVRVHTFGIDTTVNDALLTRVAEQQRGTCCLLMPTDDIAGAVARLGSRLRRPVLTGISVEGDWKLPGDAPADLHSEEIALLSLKGKAGATEVTLHGRGIDGVEQSFRVKLEPRLEPALQLFWAKGAIDFNLRRGRQDRAIALAIRYNLLCEGAAFIAWDEAEKVPVAAREIYQPSMEPRLAGRRGRPRTSTCLGSGDFVGDEGAVYDLSAVSRFMEKPAAQSSSMIYRRNVRDTELPEGWPGKLLEVVLKTRPADMQVLLGKSNLFGRALRWFAGKKGTEAIGELWMEPLLTVLFEWILETAVEAEGRLQKLEALLRGMEGSTPDSVTSLTLARTWAEREMAGAPELQKRTLELLDHYIQKEQSARPTAQAVGKSQ